MQSLRAISSIGAARSFSLPSASRRVPPAPADALSRPFAPSCAALIVLWSGVRVPAACVLIPPLLGWVEKRKPGARGCRANAVEISRLCKGTWQDAMKWRVVTANATAGLFILVVGLMNQIEATRDWEVPLIV